MLVEGHLINQLLHKLSLPGLCPALKHPETEISILVVLLLRGHGELTRVLLLCPLHHHRLSKFVEVIWQTTLLWWQVHVELESPRFLSGGIEAHFFLRLNCRVRVGGQFKSTCKGAHYTYSAHTVSLGASE